MKSLTVYIQEALQPKYQKYFKQVYQTMQSLLKDNKIQPIDVNVDNLGCPNRPFKFEDFMQDKTVLKIINDRQVGFVVTSQMIKTPNKYLIDDSGKDKKELKPECYPFSYKQDKNMYFVGISMFDKNVTYVDNFIHLVGIETSLIVSESTPVLKDMLKKSIKNILKEHQYSGISAKPEHPKMKAVLTKLGFSSMKDNKDILTYKL